MKGQEPQELIFWVIVAVLVVIFLLLFANQIIFGFMNVKEVVQP